jgi:hypothetical protein
MKTLLLPLPHPLPSVVSSIVLFRCYSLQYFLFHAIIIDLVPYKIQKEEIEAPEAETSPEDMEVDEIIRDPNWIEHGMIERSTIAK